MAKKDNLTDFLTDVADAIRAVEGTTAKINPQDFSYRIRSIPSGPSAPKWTGHADAEGLRAIGWTDEDIAYYQAHGVNWNAEDDEYHKVTEDNKALYGVLTASNIADYRERIVYLPKIDTSGLTSMDSLFAGCTSLIAIPMLDTSNVVYLNATFSDCYSLTCIPPLDTANVRRMINTFLNCYSLITIPALDTQNVTEMHYMFYNCHALTYIPQLNTSKVKNMSQMFAYCFSFKSIPPLDTANVTDMGGMFYCCHSLTNVAMLDASGVTEVNSIFAFCYSLVNVFIKNCKRVIPLDRSPLLSKQSLLYLIENEVSEQPFTITLKAYAYDKWSVDADVEAALAAHPNISLVRYS